MKSKYGFLVFSYESFVCMSCLICFLSVLAEHVLLLWLVFKLKSKELGMNFSVYIFIVRSLKCSTNVLSSRRFLRFLSSLQFVFWTISDFEWGIVWNFGGIQWRFSWILWTKNLMDTWEYFPFHGKKMVWVSIEWENQYYVTQGLER